MKHELAIYPSTKQNKPFFQNIKGNKPLFLNINQPPLKKKKKQTNQPSINEDRSIYHEIWLRSNPSNEKEKDKFIIFIIIFTFNSRLFGDYNEIIRNQLEFSITHLETVSLHHPSSSIINHCQRCNPSLPSSSLQKVHQSHLPRPLPLYKYPLDELLIKISNFPLKQLTSLKLPLESDFPTNGLQAFSKTITSLTSLTLFPCLF